MGRKTGALLLGLSTLLSGCSMQPYTPFTDSDVALLQKESIRTGEDLAIIDTTGGSFVLRFFPSEAPQAVENFITLAKQGYFDGQLLTLPLLTDSAPSGTERLLYGGSPDEGKTGSSIFEQRPLANEISPNLWPLSGAVAAFADKDGRADSRFFIIGTQAVAPETLATMKENGFPPKVIAAFQEQGGTPTHSLKANIFAQVVQGMDVVDSLLQSPQAQTVTIRTVSIEKSE